MNILLKLSCLLLLSATVSCNDTRVQETSRTETMEQKATDTDNGAADTMTLEKNGMDVDDNAMSKEAPQPEHYICFKNDDKKSRDVMLGFLNDTLAINVRYKGQTEAIPLEKTNSEFSAEGASPIIVDYYNEIYKGEITGQYRLTKSGNWYYLRYTKATGKTEYNYTINFEAENFSKEPCF